MPDPNFTAQLPAALAPLNLPPTQIAAIAEVLGELVAGAATPEAAQARVQSVFGSGNTFGNVSIAGGAAGGHLVKIGELSLHLSIPAEHAEAVGALRQEIADLHADLRSGTLRATLQKIAQTELAEKMEHLTRLIQPVVHLGDVVHGLKVDALNATNAYVAQTIIQQFFQGAAPEDGARLLADYLDRVIEDGERLRLHRLHGKQQSGAERTALSDTLTLSSVFTSLTTDAPPRVLLHGRYPAARVERFLARLAAAEERYSADYTTPDRVVQWQVDSITSARNRAMAGVEEPAALPDDELVELRLSRPALALSEIAQNRRLVLLGEPGSGKSTLLRYLAVGLASRARKQPFALPGWADDRTPVPVIVPLGKVSAVLVQHQGDGYKALIAVIGDILEADVRVGLRPYLLPALRSGGVLVLLDGLDEVPITQQDSPRDAVAAGIRRLAQETAAPLVVTCRVLPYRVAGAWQLHRAEGWAQQVVQPFALGQSRAFVRQWYTALAACDPELHDADAAAEALSAEIAESAQLQDIAASPLLLTMLSILHLNTGSVPTDRVRLYEECLELLLERWEPVRQPGMPRQSLVARLGLPNLEPLRRTLHALAYRAHTQPMDRDGRGIIPESDLARAVYALFYGHTGSRADAEEYTEALLAIITHDDGGLLQRRSDEGFAIPHLTFQEYMAACHLADHPQMAQEAYPRWCGADRERWHEVLLLLVGRLAAQGKTEDKAIPWLQGLVSVRANPSAQWQRDVGLAAASYRELVERGALATLFADREIVIDRPLREAAVRWLSDPSLSAPLHERLLVGGVLGKLGDPRYPVRVAEWQRELAQRNEHFGQPNGYWCFMPAGIYQIGGWEEGAESAAIPLAPYWIARYPITVAQYAAFVVEGYTDAAEAYWTPEGWAWKQGVKWAQPWGWADSAFKEPNQPVIEVTWYEATAYCAWLSAQLRMCLPAGYTMRLATEAEWEAAASFDGNPIRRPYPWGDGEPSPELAIYDEAQVGRPAPVGSCPAGVAFCGALDMAGNVWEVTSSRHSGYPQQSGVVEKDFTLEEFETAWRGGAYDEQRTDVCCEARSWSNPGGHIDIDGFRVVLAPRPHGRAEF